MLIQKLVHIFLVSMANAFWHSSNKGMIYIYLCLPNATHQTVLFQLMGWGSKRQSLENDEEDEWEGGGRARA